MTLVGFKKMTIGDFDSTGKIPAANIYVIEGADTLRRVNTIEEACQRIDGTTRTLEDLLCSASEI